jgi:integrase/recombinase XerC
MELIDAYCEALRQASRSPDTINGRRAILERLDAALPYGAGQVTRDDLAAWLYNDQWSQNTKATYWRTIRSFYTWACDPKDPWLAGDNPTDDMTPVRTADGIARPCTDEQLGRILADAAQPFRTWALLAAYQGLRAGEIAQLDRECVTEQQLFIVRGKGGRPRAQDVPQDVWSALRGLPPGPVARRADTGERASAHYVSVYARDHFQRTLKINTSLHKLRHWLGCTVQDRYRDIRVTQALLGHRQLSSTQIYTQATDQQQRNARSTLPRLAGEGRAPEAGDAAGG